MTDENLSPLLNKMPELDIAYRKLMIQQPVSRWQRWLIFAVFSFSGGLVLTLLAFQFSRELLPPLNFFLWVLGMSCLLLTWSGLRMLVNIAMFLSRLRRLPLEGRLIEGYLADRWEQPTLFGMKRQVICFIFQPAEMKLQKRYAIRVENNPAAYASLQVGDRVSIRFLPDSPQISQLVEYS